MGKTEVVESTLRLPGAKKQVKIASILTEDEDFRFARIKLNKESKPRYSLAAPTDEDEDNVEMKKSFRAAIVLARKNFFQSEQDKEKGIDPKEKRALYLVREGVLLPELFYVSPSALRNWKTLVKTIVEDYQSPYYGVLVEFTGEHIDNAKNGFSWNKPKFEVVRVLTEEEMEWMTELHSMVDNRVKEYEKGDDLDKYEENAGIVKPGAKAKGEDEDEDPRDRHAKGVQASINDDDDEDEKPKAKPKAKPEDDDDEDEKPKAKPKAKPEDDDEDNGKQSKGRAGYPSLDDDD